MIIALAAGTPAWLQKVQRRWPGAEARSLSANDSQVLIYKDRLNLISHCIGEVYTGSRGGLYVHDGRYPSEVGERKGGACSGIEWGDGRVVAFRDLFGFSPIWYVLAPGEGGVAVASHPKWLRALLEERGQVHVGRLAGFLAGKDAGDRQDFFEGLWRLKPGERLSWCPGRARISSTALEVEPTPEGGKDPEGWAKRLREVLEARLRHMKDAGVMGLSGGIDSGLVTAAWIGAHPGERLEAVSMVSDRWKDVDERSALDQWVQYAPITSHRWCLDKDGPLGDVGMFARHADLGPQAHGGVVSMAKMLGFARQTVRQGVLLTGIGGDQIFECDDAQWMLSALWGGMCGALQRRHREGGGWALYGGLVRPWLQSGWIGEARQGFGRALMGLTRRQGLGWGDVSGWLTPKTLEAAHALPTTPEGRYGWREGWVWEDVTRHALLCTLESGVRFAHPLLDWEVVDVVRKVSPAFFMHPQPKALARLALCDRMPEPVRRLPKRASFCSLIEQSIAEHATTTLQDLFANSRLEAMGLLDKQAFLSILNQFSGWAREREALAVPRHVGILPLWRTISAELWLQSLSSTTNPNGVSFS